MAPHTPISITCFAACWMWPSTAVCIWSTNWLSWWLPTNFYLISTFIWECGFQIPLVMVAPKFCCIKWQRLVELQLWSTWISTIKQIPDLYNKFSLTWINANDLIFTTQCLENNCGGIAVETEVHRVTAVLSNAQGIWDTGYATRTAGSRGWLCVVWYIKSLTTGKWSRANRGS